MELPTRPLLVLFLAIASSACAGRQAHGRTPDVVALEELRITARPEGGGYEFEAVDAETLFQRGLEAGRRADCDAARAAYLRVVDEFPASRYVSASLYNAALCFQQAGRLPDAAPLYERLLVQGGDARDVRHALFQLAAIEVRLERFDAALASADRLLALRDLDPDERMEALARRAEALLGAGRWEEARREAEGALRYFRTRPESAPVARDDFAALATFVLAETYRVEAHGIVVPAGEVTDQRAVLERRADRVLEAQRLYFDTIRFRVPEQAAAAGYRIGGLYEDFWEAIMAAPPPPPRDPASIADPERFAAEYRLALARLAKPLIRHSIRYWEMALLLIERNGVPSEWTDRIRTDLEHARERLSAQPDGPEGLPSTARAGAGPGGG
ncbi:MAG: tetratricopeptide repeat protein [Polyangiales bacterium]